jgi:hypothetical protein
MGLDLLRSPLFLLTLTPSDKVTQLSSASTADLQQAENVEAYLFYGVVEAFVKPLSCQTSWQFWQTTAM